MRYQKVFIEGLAYVVPDTEVTTAAIERMLGRLYQRIGLAPGFLETLTGIRARHFWADGIKPSSAATRAAEKAIADCGIERERIQALINTSVCKDYLEPSTASIVHGNLGLSRQCVNFDLGNACLGFMMGIVTVANMIELGQIEVGMVVAGEGSRTVTQSTVGRLLKPRVGIQDLIDNLATLTLGSGAVAMVLAHERVATRGHRLLGGVSLAATEHNGLCVGTETSMKTEPAKLLAEGVKLARQTWSQLCEEQQIDPAAVREFVLHQVGKANHDALLGNLGLPEDRALRVYPELGNVGAAGVPLTLASAVEQGRINPGDLIALMGIGSGLNCSMMAVQW